MRMRCGVHMCVDYASLLNGLQITKKWLYFLYSERKNYVRYPKRLLEFGLKQEENEQVNVLDKQCINMSDHTKDWNTPSYVATNHT